MNDTLDVSIELNRTDDSFLAYQTTPSRDGSPGGFRSNFGTPIPSQPEFSDPFNFSHTLACTPAYADRQSISQEDRPNCAFLMEPVVPIYPTTSTPASKTPAKGILRKIATFNTAAEAQTHFDLERSVTPRPILYSKSTPRAPQPYTPATSANLVKRAIRKSLSFDTLVERLNELSPKKDDASDFCPYLYSVPTPKNPPPTPSSPPASSNPPKRMRKSVSFDNMLEKFNELPWEGSNMEVLCSAPTRMSSPNNPSPSHYTPASTKPRSILKSASVDSLETPDLCPRLYSVSTSKNPPPIPSTPKPCKCMRKSVSFENILDVDDLNERQETSDSMEVLGAASVSMTTPKDPSPLPFTFNQPRPPAKQTLHKSVSLKELDQQLSDTKVSMPSFYTLTSTPRPLIKSKSTFTVGVDIASPIWPPTLHHGTITLVRHQKISQVKPSLTFSQSLRAAVAKVMEERNNDLASHPAPNQPTRLEGLSRLKAFLVAHQYPSLERLGRWPGKSTWIPLAEFFMIIKFICDMIWPNEFLSHEEYQTMKPLLRLENWKETTIRICKKINFRPEIKQKHLRDPLGTECSRIVSANFLVALMALAEEKVGFFDRNDR